MPLPKLTPKNQPILSTHSAISWSSASLGTRVDFAFSHVVRASMRSAHVLNSRASSVRAFCLTYGRAGVERCTCDWRLEEMKNARANLRDVSQSSSHGPSLEAAKPRRIRSNRTSRKDQTPNCERSQHEENTD